VVGVPPVSFFPLQTTRSHSRTIFVSHLRALEPFTVTSWAAAYSAIEGTGVRPGGRGLAAAAAGGGVAAGGATVSCLAVGLSPPERLQPIARAARSGKGSARMARRW
jgi:hypothetical protein